MRVLDVSKVRSSFATIVDRVRGRQEVVVIIRYRQPIAALVPTRRLTASERKALGMGSSSDGPTLMRRQ